MQQVGVTPSFFAIDSKCGHNSRIFFGLRQRSRENLAREFCLRVTYGLETIRIKRLVANAGPIEELLCALPEGVGEPANATNFGIRRVRSSARER
jgi:hypothetical protein